MNRVTVLLVAVLAVLAVGDAVAVPVTGIPVSALGADTTVGKVGVDGTIEFFIPLSGGYKGVYGVDGVGTQAGFFNGTWGAGSMDMFLKFSPINPSPGLGTLTLDFSDLDLADVNDPAGFLESVTIFDNTMTQIGAPITDVDDPRVISHGGNNDPVVISVGLGEISDPFFAKLKFTAGPVSGLNTPEYLLATVDTFALQTSPVPEPATLTLCSLGLLGLGVVARRRRRQ